MSQSTTFPIINQEYLATKNLEHEWVTSENWTEELSKEASMALVKWWTNAGVEYDMEELGPRMESDIDTIKDPLEDMRMLIYRSSTTEGKPMVAVGVIGPYLYAGASNSASDSEDGLVISFGSKTQPQKPQKPARREIVSLDWLGVDNELQGKGWGSVMVQHLKQQVHSEGNDLLAETHGGTEVNEANLQKFYTRNGFTHSSSAENESGNPEYYAPCPTATTASGNSG